MRKKRTVNMIEQKAVAARAFFYVGGKTGEVNGKQFMEGQMFIEAYAPKKETKPYPLIFFHGAGQTNVNWLVTPDGRKGWADYFVEQGYRVYLAEQPCRGRSAYHYSSENPLVFHDLEDLRIRFVSDLGTWPQGRRHTQFPGWGQENEAEVLAEFNRGQVEYLPDNRLVQQLVLDCAGELLEITGPAILVTHSQAGPFGWNILDRYPDLVKGVIALEPAGPVFGRNLKNPAAPNYGISELPLTFSPPVSGPEDFVLEILKAPAPGLLDGWHLAEERTLPNFRHAAILLVVSEASYHAGFDHLVSEFFRQTKVPHDFVRLEEAGIYGNSHMMMLEKNNLEIAALLDRWLCEKFAG